jgi:hypothetical protein
MEEQIVKVQGQLEAIKAGANTLLHANWIEAPDPALQAQLVRIWETLPRSCSCIWTSQGHWRATVRMPWNRLHGCMS